MNQRRSPYSDKEKPPTSKRGVQRSVVLPQEMWEKLQENADANYCSVSQVIREIIRKAIDSTPDVV